MSPRLQAVGTCGGLVALCGHPGPACRQLGRGVEAGVEKLLLGPGGLGPAGTTTTRWGLGGYTLLSLGPCVLGLASPAGSQFSV